MKILDGQVALGGKSGTKALGEHKVNLAFALTAAIHARDVRSSCRTDPQANLC
jgi:hypothetical protein